MNYYTFKPFPKLNIETFYRDDYWKNSVCTLRFTNALMVKFIWGFKDQGTWAINARDSRCWLEK